MASMKTLRYLALLALFISVAVAPGIVSAQDGTGVIQGTVKGPAGNVVSEVSVSVGGTNLVAVTRLDGAYRLAPVPVGDHTLTFSYLGLVSATADVTVVWANR